MCFLPVAMPETFLSENPTRPEKRENTKTKFKTEIIVSGLNSGSTQSQMWYTRKSKTLLIDVTSMPPFPFSSWDSILQSFAKCCQLGRWLSFRQERKYWSFFSILTLLTLLPVTGSCYVFWCVLPKLVLTFCFICKNKRI